MQWEHFFFNQKKLLYSSYNHNVRAVLVECIANMFIYKFEKTVKYKKLPEKMYSVRYGTA